MFPVKDLFRLYPLKPYQSFSWPDDYLDLAVMIHGSLFNREFPVKG